MSQPELEICTERLLLIPMNSNDLAFFHCVNTEPFVRKYLWDGEEIPVELSEKILTEIEDNFQKQNWGLWKIKRVLDGKYVGYVGLWIFFDEEQPQLLFALLPEFTGNGYANEGSMAIIQYSFDELGFTYLKASLDSPNSESAKVCEKLGMRFVEEKKMDGKLTSFYQIDKVEY